MIGLTKIIELKTSDWKRLLQLCVQWIRADMKLGIMQDGKTNLQYLSQQYKRYKANQMKQLKYGRSLYSPEANKLMRSSKVSKKALKGKGDRLWAYHGKAIESTNTAYVDMTLTGDLKKGLKVKSVNVSGGMIGYEPEDTKKLQGNRRYGREIVGLNEANKDKLKDEIVEIFQKNALTILSKDINITVTL